MDSDSSNTETNSTVGKLINLITNKIKPMNREFGKPNGEIDKNMFDANTQNSAQSIPPDFLQNIDEQEFRMIKAILNMENTQAREIMIPRVDILATDVNTSPEELVKLMSDGGHSRIPIYSETIDNIFGILHARDMLGLLINKDHGMKLNTIARPALFIPESKRLEELLREFQEKHVTMAIVVDEHGGVAGLVTMEDLLEEIVGEIEDEFTDVEPEIIQINENEAILDARVNLERANELFSVSLEGDGFESIGGVVYKQLGKIPRAGDKIKHNELSIEVLSTEGRRINKLRVIKELPEQDE